MAKLLLDEGTIESDLSEIVRELAPLGIELRHYDPGTSLLFPNLLDQEVLTESEKLYIIELHNSVFEFIQQENGTVWSDLLNIHPGSPSLHQSIATYGRYHTHTTVEPIYVLAGEAIYGFVRPDGSQVQLLIQAQDYLYIPAGVEHWCSPSALLNFKAVRYFANAEGWVPKYTGTQMTDYLNKPR
ncbi:acireductone dioxygenase [Nostoc linckia z18]|jgi:1,2-dihydroxy-3-keto-5-methylthiopentene dioxygenase|uniref:Acireductone dioxygenase n=2 Tax=Nostoc linckia TaxID=92942 RepID=A0A9Q6EIQ8_NOSLI|nr:acireductone dioxygenase [Nostoc linckia]PHK30928.1 acireductone dioxygenase [Nostoc linckia z15]PHK47557.1 acireductone dioxygenase [Nostoc linckia z16]PHJ56312.1 acireductone dioxygenase [Nostoc linckia z1]PHJ58254.1 acireductone dioxygenase [Nostoc linckia z3]PHJ61001.1 acireductone dioxygenase [Nostoc linckia z2]